MHLVMESQINPPHSPPPQRSGLIAYRLLVKLLTDVLPLLSVSLFIPFTSSQPCPCQSFQFLIDKKTLEEVLPPLPLTWWWLECD